MLDPIHLCVKGKNDSIRDEVLRTWQTRDHVLMLRVHRGFFLSMGVGGRRRFEDVMYWTDIAWRR